MTDPATYAGYEAWKGWAALFAYTADEARGYAGEMRGLRINGAEVLEIGFGAGGFLAWAKDQGARVSGIEVIPALQEAAKRQGVRLLEPDFERHAERYAAQFDTIVAFDVFEHFTQTQIRERLAAAAVLLKPGGGLALRFPNAQSPFGLAPQHGDATHVTPLSRGVVEQLLGETPLTVERYGNAYRNAGSGLTAVVRRARYFVRDAATGLLGWAYALPIPWDPVVTIVLRKRA